MEASQPDPQTEATQSDPGLPGPAELPGGPLENRQLDVVTAESRAEDPHVQDDYEPVFGRDSYIRRVLAFVTDDEDSAATPEPGTAPRNTSFAIFWAMRSDHPGKTEEDVQQALNKLAEAGLVECPSGDVYQLTDAGHVERKN